MAKTGTAGEAPLPDDDIGASGDGERVVRESGIAPARVRSGSESTFLDGGDEHLQLALAESTRAEANLSSLLRGLQHLTAGARSARDANAALSRELDTVREMLERSRVEEQVQRRRVRLLEQSLVSEKRDGARERAAFIEQEDLFLAELLDGHEREIRDLRQTTARSLSRAEKSSTPPADPEPAALAAVQLRTVRIPLPSRRDDGPIEPDALDRLAPPRPSSRPPLKQKADPSTRPLVEYRLGSGDVAEERIDDTRRSSRPPPSGAG